MNHYRNSRPESPEGFGDQIAAETVIDGIRDSEIETTLRLKGFKNINYALVQVQSLKHFTVLTLVMNNCDQASN